MKRILILFSTLLLAYPSFAQSELSIASSSDKKISLEMLSHVGYGWHFVKSDDFRKAGSGEFFFNILNLDIRPAEVFGLSLGADLEFNSFDSKKDMFFLNEDKKVLALPFVDGFDKTRSEIHTTSFNFPLLATFYFNDFHVGFGAEGTLNTGGYTHTYTKQGYVTDRHNENKAKVNRFSYGLTAFLSYDNLGVYFKFYPKSSKVLPDGSVNFSFWTLGVAFGL